MKMKNKLQKIGVAVDLTANHGGWFEFEICGPMKDKLTKVSIHMHAANVCLSNHEELGLLNSVGFTANWPANQSNRNHPLQNVLSILHNDYTLSDG